MLRDDEEAPEDGDEGGGGGGEARNSSGSAMGLGRGTPDGPSNRTHTPTAFQQLAPKAHRLRLLPHGVPPHLLLGLRPGPQGLFIFPDSQSDVKASRHHPRSCAHLGWAPENAGAGHYNSQNAERIVPALCSQCACAKRGAGLGGEPLPHTRFLDEEDGWEMESSASLWLVRDSETLLAAASSVAPAQSRRGAGTPRSKGGRPSLEG